MKVSGIISALIFAHVAMGQAADSTSAVTTTSVAASASSSAHGSQSGTKTGTKTGTKSASQSSSAAPDATPTGSTSSVGPLSESYTGDSNPLIPDGISDACSAFLTSLNSDTTVSNCLTPLNNALASFTSGSGSASAVSKTLSSLCSTNSCSTSTMRTKLTEFKDACSADFSSNDMVAKQYDVWYSLIPFKSAICAKDADTQAYCLLDISSSSSSTSNTRRSDVAYAANHLERSVHKRAQTVLMPNTDTFRSSNLMYLFISPELNAGELCTSCTQQILSKYVAWESATPYALGIGKSTLLGGQIDLWAAIGEKCSATFTTEITNTAGVASADQLADGAVTTTASYFTALAAAFAAALALF